MNLASCFSELIQTTYNFGTVYLSFFHSLKTPVHHRNQLQNLKSSPKYTYQQISLSFSFLEISTLVQHQPLFYRQGTSVVLLSIFQTEKPCSLTSCRGIISMGHTATSY